MILLRVVFLALSFLNLVFCERVKRQDLNQEEYIQQICAKTSPGAWFRLQSNECRNVVQCNDGVLQNLRCPHGLAFDIELQACNWKASVKNCADKHPVIRVKPNFNTIEPQCKDDGLACGDNTCLPRILFCNGIEDCDDGSDETACDINSDPNRAPKCDPSVCIPPKCFCQSPRDNIDMPYRQDQLKSIIPQMITITFDDAINNNNIDLYKYDIFTPERRNPNGCTIKGTFFLSHKYTNYTAVEDIFSLGHEIAVHSISHNNSEEYWSKTSQLNWHSEMAGMREIIAHFGNVQNDTIIGVRAPYLRTGGNNQFKMMEVDQFVYDSTITAPLQNPPLWPYTLEYRMPHKCHGNAQKCPTRPFPVWEMVMNELDRREDTNSNHLSGCAMVDSCFSNQPTAEQFTNFLEHNFNRSYTTNKAPLGLYFHSAFLKNNPDLLNAFTVWVDNTLALYDDVYFVSMNQVLEWITFAENIADIKQFDVWKEPSICDPPSTARCIGGNNCRLGSTELPGETIHLSTCNTCPNYYPWLDDPFGQGI